jgi:hypothetical protein
MFGRPLIEFLIAATIMRKRGLQAVLGGSMAMMGMILVNSHVASAETYTEKRPDNFVLSEGTPVSIGHNIFFNHSISTEPVDILSYGVHFRIPRNYIETIRHSARDRVVDFVLVTLFPDFEGVQSGAESGKLTDENKIWRWKNSPNLFRILTVGGDVGKNKTADVNENVFNAEKNQPDLPWQFGLLKSSNSLAASNLDVYFQRKTDTTSGFVLFCHRNFADALGCWARIRVSDDLMVEYQFHRELVPRWKEIHERMSALIQSFVIK